MDLEVRTRDDVMTITFNRPAQLNALTAEMSDRLADELEQTVGRDDVRVVVLTGAGSAFCSGADLSGEQAHEHFDVTSLDRANRVARAIVSLPKPVLAAVNGVAAGVGCSMALTCDLVVATESAGFLLAFARIGLMPDGGASATVAASIGRARAMRMALLGEAMPARTAYDCGLISHVTTDAEFGAELAGLAQRLASGPPLAYAATKKAVNAATLTELEAALGRERTGQTVLLGTADVAEGMRAFTEKRRPSFCGR